MSSELPARHHQSSADSRRADSLPLAPSPVSLSEDHGQTIRVVIIEDERILAETLGAWLERDSVCTIAGQAAQAQAGWELCLAQSPDLVLVDVGLPDGDGLMLAKRLSDDPPGF